jgi:hypothetical protein
MRDRRGQERRVCPNERCKNHSVPSFDFTKDGFYLRKTGKKDRVQRYRCKSCGKRFHGTYGRLTYRQRKPEINKPFVEVYLSGVSLRRTAHILKVNRKTLARRILTQGAMARKSHEDRLLKSDDFKGRNYSFDDMITKVGSKYFPVSLSIAVNEDTGKIVDIKVSRINAYGYPARNSSKVPGLTKVPTDLHNQEMINVLSAIKIASKGTKFFLHTDKANNIVSTGRIALGKNFVHKPVKAPKKGEQRAGFSAMFWLNHVCARIRADLARMGRSSWCFSRSMDSLQSHLDMFMEFFNNRQYRIAS